MTHQTQNKQAGLSVQHEKKLIIIDIQSFKGFILEMDKITHDTFKGLTLKSLNSNTNLATIMGI